MSAKWLVSYRRSEEGWEASVYTVPGCHVEGRTMAEAKSRVHSALLLFFEAVDPRDIMDAPVEHPLRPILREQGQKGIESVGDLIRGEPECRESLPDLDDSIHDPTTVSARRHRT